MKKNNNPIIEEIIKEGEGHALFIGFEYSKPKIIFVSCSIEKGIKYYDFKTTKEIDPSSITRIIQFTHSSSKETENAILVDLFYKHANDLSEKNESKEIEYSDMQLKHIKKGDYYYEKVCH